MERHGLGKTLLCCGMLLSRHAAHGSRCGCSSRPLLVDGSVHRSARHISPKVFEAGCEYSFSSAASHGEEPSPSRHRSARHRISRYVSVHQSSRRMRVLSASLPAGSPSRTRPSSATSVVSQSYLSPMFFPPTPRPYCCHEHSSLQPTANSSSPSATDHSPNPSSTT